MSTLAANARTAQRVRVRGVVQGVGFRPHVYRLARAHGLDGWVLNDSAGVEIHVEGTTAALEAFRRDLVANAPPASRITAIDVETCALESTVPGFEIRSSVSENRPTTRVSPDLPLCDDCVRAALRPREHDDARMGAV